MANYLKANKPPSLRPKIIWGRPNNCETVVSEKSWSASYTHHSIDTSVVMFKAGNKPYVLFTGEERGAAVFQAGLLKKYSALYPVGDCFFAVHVMDGTKSYRPESQIVFDLPTAHAFFAANPEKTLSLVGDAVRALAKRWNDEHASKAPNERSFESTYIVLSEHVFEKKDGKGKNPLPVNTKLVLVISNYHFNREQQDNNKKFKPCNPSDCTVGLKFSCTEFVTEKSLGNLYHFDKNGAIFPYATFVSLMKDQRFQNEFMRYAKEKYEEFEGPLLNIDQTEVDADLRCDIEEEEADLEVELERKRARRSAKSD